MKAGDIVSVSGCITKEKFIAGRTLIEIEKVLGFHGGRDGCMGDRRIRTAGESASSGAA